MNRYIYLDNLRGLSFILMIIHHIIYIYDVSNNFNTLLSSHTIIKTCGYISRTLFILLAGISLALYNKKENFNNLLKKRFNRSLRIFLHGCLISGITYFYYPDKFVRFGILQFLSLSTLLLFFITPFKNISLIVFCLSLIYKPPYINSFINIIIGPSTPYRMIDWFPINTPWISIMLFGVIIGQHIDLKIFNNIKYISSNTILTKIGQNSLDLYTSHLILLIIFYSLKKK